MATITPGPVPYGAILYATSAANLRDGPGIVYDKVGSLAAGQQITALSSVVSDGDLWVLVSAGQWVAGKLLSDKAPVAGGGGAGTSPPPPYSPPADSGSMGTVVVALAAVAAGFIAYKWASKGRK